MKNQERKWDWVALMVDVDPDDLKNCICDFPAKLYVPPDEYRPGERTARQCWVSVPGKHRNWKAAWGAFHDMMAAGAALKLIDTEAQPATIGRSRKALRR